MFVEINGSKFLLDEIHSLSKPNLTVTCTLQLKNGQHYNFHAGEDFSVFEQAKKQLDMASQKEEVRKEQEERVKHQRHLEIKKAEARLTLRHSLYVAFTTGLIAALPAAINFFLQK